MLHNVFKLNRITKLSIPLFLLRALQNLPLLFSLHFTTPPATFPRLSRPLLRVARCGKGGETGVEMAIVRKESNLSVIARVL